MQCCPDPDPRKFKLKAWTGMSSQNRPARLSRFRNRVCLLAMLLITLPCAAQYELGSPLFQGDWCQRIAQALQYANSAGLATLHLYSDMLPINPRNPTPQQMCSVPPFANLGSITGMLVEAPVGAIFQAPGGQIQIPAKVRLAGLGNLSGLMTNSTFVACNTNQIQPGPQPCSSSFVTSVNSTSS